MQKEYLTLFKKGLFRGCSWREVQKALPSLKSVKIGTVISYLRKNKKIYESLDTTYEFC